MDLFNKSPKVNNTDLKLDRCALLLTDSKQLISVFLQFSYEMEKPLLATTFTLVYPTTPVK